MLIASATELGQSLTIPTEAIPAVAIQLCSYPTIAAGYHQATTVVSREQLSMLQLREDGALCSRMAPAEAKQLTASFGTCGQSVEGPIEGSCTTD
jgi:hypothetical protein